MAVYKIMSEQLFKQSELNSNKGSLLLFLRRVIASLTRDGEILKTSLIFEGFMQSLRCFVTSNSSD